ncbi:Monooxygenase FAD-binding [Penicillium cf. griseofulvum]|uniref:Monooxygenase FAD-binding n=1 Tax=Penicillium cf. griseofulvum TaxID=2972120 RepID=A0A9W9M449_9EURO|nr:Monooxygenase FAD-binding [Penicillium cf. griseofulvum]KAJ5434738.1 Monooxygenase FAD-binding [Penicillium cf. griseofulvum]
MAPNDSGNPNPHSWILNLVTADPGLPRPNPTQSYWQHVPHALADVRSSSLPTDRDVAIIGSGITGLSVARSLLERHPTATVSVLEARALCSGATGRNGGQMAANAGEQYMHLAETHGVEAAGKIVDFTFHNLEQMQELIKEYDAVELSEMQRLQKLRVFLTQGKFDDFKKSIARLEMDHPSKKGLYTILDADAVLNEYGIHGASGGALLPAGTVWPYRLVTKVFAALLEKYPGRLTIETNTPVESVEHMSTPTSLTTRLYPYTLHTPRGPLRARTVVHCTNGYSGHLLPHLRGLVHPFKGTMTVQDPQSAVSNQGTAVSWGFHYPPSYDPRTKRLGYGLYYLGQSAKTGYFYFGGEHARLEESVSADDTFVADHSVKHLEVVLPRFFGKNDRSDWRLISSWSGIMGYSSDGLPLVGRLSPTLTGREGDGEWIAAAFNGYGMANSLMSGKALALMILGEDVSDWLPVAYGLGEKRLQETLTVPGAVNALRSKL